MSYSPPVELDATDQIPTASIQPNVVYDTSGTLVPINPEWPTVGTHKSDVIRDANNMWVYWARDRIMASSAHAIMIKVGSTRYTLGSHQCLRVDFPPGISKILCVPYRRVDHSPRYTMAEFNSVIVDHFQAGCDLVFCQCDPDTVCALKYSEHGCHCIDCGAIFDTHSEWAVHTGVSDLIGLCWFKVVYSECVLNRVPVSIAQKPKHKKSEIIIPTYSHDSVVKRLTQLRTYPV